MSDFLKPPRVPTAIMNFFASQSDLPILSGDMGEEFQQRARRSGPRVAELWFWRESIRNAWALTSRELLQTPVQVGAMAVGCLVAVSFIPGLSEYFAAQPIRRLHLGPYARWAVLIALELYAPLIVGSASARVAVGREWALTLCFTLFSICWAALASFIFLNRYPMSARKEDLLIVWHLPRVAAFWLGSLWVRQLRRSTLLAGSER
jgi:hypothetical protein